jgi:hypothetical protein
MTCDPRSSRRQWFLRVGRGFSPDRLPALKGRPTFFKTFNPVSTRALSIIPSVHKMICIDT